MKKNALQKNIRHATFLGIAFCLGVFLTSFTQEKVIKKRVEVLSNPTLDYGNFTLTYDSKNRVPLWTHEHLTSKSIERKASRNQLYFSQDAQIYPLHRSSLKDYQKSGFDRGHMAPAANHQSSIEALKNTFYLTNICPQNASLNRGLWASLERSVRGYVTEEKEVDVITGPLFLPSQDGNKRYIYYQLIGENDVAVPTHFFKLIVKDRETLAYIIPNQNISDKTPIENYRTSVEVLEKVSGLQFKMK